MKKRLLIFICGIFSVQIANAQTPGKVHNLSMPSEILGVERNYSVYLPQNYDSTEKIYPVLYLLHGAGDNNVSGWVESGNVQQIANREIRSGMASEMVIVMPDAGTGTKGYFNQEQWRYEDYFFNELIPYIEKNYRVRQDKAGRAIAGLSMGGGGSVIYALHHPDMFSSVCSLSGALGMPEDINNSETNDITQPDKGNNALYIITHAEDRQKETFKTIRWYADCGDDDFLYLSNVHFYMAMRGQGIPIQYRMRDGGHTWDYWQSALPDLMQFISIGFDKE